MACDVSPVAMFFKLCAGRALPSGGWIDIIAIPPFTNSASAAETENGHITTVCLETRLSLAYKCTLATQGQEFDIKISEPIQRRTMSSYVTTFTVCLVNMFQKCKFGNSSIMEKCCVFD